jgi:hypothetical protein
MLGRKVKCPQCSTTFLPDGSTGTAEEESRGKASSLKDRPSERRERRDEPAEPEDRERSRRPEEEEEDLVYRAPRRSRFQTAADPGRGAVLLVLGIFSIVLALAAGVAYLVGACCFLPVGGVPALIGLALGIVAWSMAQRDNRRIRQGQIDPAAQGTTTGGLVCGIIGTVLNGICVLIGLVFLVAFLGCLGAIITSPPPPSPAPAPAPAPVPPPPRRKIEGALVPPPLLLPAIGPNKHSRQGGRFLNLGNETSRPWPL